MILEGVKGSEWKLIRPIQLDVATTDSGEFIAKDLELGVYGIGDTPEQAVEAFGEMLIDLYEELIGSSDLSASLTLLLEQLSQIIQPAPNLDKAFPDCLEEYDTLARFDRGWRDMVEGRTYPISTLWETLDEG